ncbi:MAG: aldose 1-epimerase family protein, partial [Acidimicrobiales bacterium]
DVAYALSDTGLRVETSATNVGTDPCPYGTGHHPYLSAGGSLDRCRVTVRAATRIVTDERQLPTGQTSTEGTPFDLGRGPLFGDRQVDHAFTDLERDPGGKSWIRLVRADGRTTELWMDENYRYLQLYSGDTLALDRRRLGLAVEPMTCPPDAFRTGEDVIRLEPSETITCVWGIGAA